MSEVISTRKTRRASFKSPFPQSKVTTKAPSGEKKFFSELSVEEKDKLLEAVGIALGLVKERK